MKGPGNNLSRESTGASQDHTAKACATIVRRWDIMRGSVGHWRKHKLLVMATIGEPMVDILFLSVGQGKWDVGDDKVQDIKDKGSMKTT